MALKKILLNFSAMDPDDLDAVMKIEEASFSLPWTENMFTGEMLKNRFACYITGKDDCGLLLGYAGMWVIFDEAHITTLAVHPLHRGRGVGSLLLERLLQEAISSEVRLVFLEVRDSNAQARRIYERFGFEVISKRKKYYHDEDALVMRKTIGNF